MKIGQNGLKMDFNKCQKLVENWLKIGTKLIKKIGQNGSKIWFFKNVNNWLKIGQNGLKNWLKNWKMNYNKFRNWLKIDWKLVKIDQKLDS